MAGKLLNSDGQEIADTNGSLPWWARISAATAVIVIALYLVFQQSTDLKVSVTQIKDEQRVHIFQTNYYMRQICLNTAKDETQRAGCGEPLK